MVLRAMAGRWTTCGMQLFCSVLLIIALEIRGCLSLNSEGLALFQFRAKLEFDPFGALANWNPDDSDPCMWSGIECVDGNVVLLDLNGHDLEGELAPELGNLSHLRFLDLSKNYLSGNIPRGFGQLTSLEVLDLRDNNLSGPLPTELGKLRSLKRLLLCNNRFEGSMPVEIEKLSLLTDLQLDGIFTTADAAGIGCTNRKFGHCILQSASKQPKKSARTPTKRSIPHYLNLLPHFGSELSQNHADDSYNNLTDPPEQRFIQNTYEEVNTARRILVEQSTNLVALPPNIPSLPPLEPEATLPSRSSGSFPAVPTVSPPVPSPPLGQEDKPPDTAAGDSGSSLIFIIGISAAIFFLILLAIMFIISRSRAAKTIVPWKTGLSGQLQKAFVTGVPKLNRAELETACEDFSNIITTQDGVATLYKGTLSSGVEICVASTAIASTSAWSKQAELAFRKKIDSLSRVNHKNFVNLLGYCEEDKPFTRMMVFEYAPNGTLFEHLHVEEYEHLDWEARMRIIMGTAYCLLYMHELNPPIAVVNLTSKEILLTDDYAAKISDVAFWEDLITKSKAPAPAENESEHSLLPPLADVETNVYFFGILLLQIISGRLPYSKENGDLLNWASQHFNDKSIKNLVDPALESVKDNELEVVCEVIQMCTQQEARKRPSMKEAVQILRQALGISPEAATPRLSPLWWAELEILSQEAA
ncbi:protein MALE DISCOVERER 2-like isoform X2 [Salvia miltiorrhiza]|uniref:protein MALE DISCOVERER 2-like isoform X2 n=1 Tax=Salvia miltiorrhiza TaxID=226208 RepID=UPI0025AD8D9B|nr:protein MALE DISCOVERER 2-like isoform X2 [Salvia miltiorrhiza]